VECCHQGISEQRRHKEKRGRFDEKGSRSQDQPSVTPPEWAAPFPPREGESQRHDDEQPMFRPADKPRDPSPAAGIVKAGSPEL